MHACLHSQVHWDIEISLTTQGVQDGLTQVLASVPEQGTLLPASTASQPEGQTCHAKAHNMSTSLMSPSSSRKSWSTE